MDLSNILSVGISALVLTVLIHVTVFYVVRTMYPPVRKVTFVEPTSLPSGAPHSSPPPTTTVPPPVVFTEALNTIKQDVVVPTYEATVPSETPRQEGSTTIEDLSMLTTTTG